MSYAKYYEDNYEIAEERALFKKQEEQPFYCLAKEMDHKVYLIETTVSKAYPILPTTQKKKDKKIICCQCGEPFLFKGGEQRYFEKHNLCEPKRCHACREKSKEQSQKAGCNMNEFEYTSPEEEALLSLLNELKNSLPKNQAWIIHPTNYPRIMKSIDRILKVIKKESPGVDYHMSFDELLGTDLGLTVEDWSFSFYGCGDITEAISLADTFDIEGLTDGKARLVFGFRNARIPLFPKKNDTQNTGF